MLLEHKLTTFVLLFLSPLATHAVDSTHKLRGKDNDLGNLSPVPDESGFIGLSTGEEESSILDEAQVQEVESIDTKRSNNVKNNFLKQMKIVSDRKLQYGSDYKVGCRNWLDCESGFVCFHGTCIAKTDNGEYCDYDQDCWSGYCSSSLVCEDKLAPGESCEYDQQCSTQYCSATTYTCKIAPGENCARNPDECPTQYYCSDDTSTCELAPGETCEYNEQCSTQYCSTTTYTCKIAPGENCAYNQEECTTQHYCSPDTYTCEPACFSSETTVTHSERGLIPISEIEVGDYVQSRNNGLFSRVYVFEKNHHTETSFVQIYSSKGVVLELTDRHMLFLKNRNNPVPARDIRVGDILDTNEDSGTRVEKIGIVRREGYYGPLTEDGTIVVNDNVYASSHVAAKESASYLYSERDIVSWETLAQIGTAPLRLTCKAVWFGYCSDEKFQNEEGLHKFIVFLDNASELPSLLQLVVFPFLFSMGVIFTVLELFYDEGEAFYKTVSSSTQQEGSLGFFITCSLTLAALVPSAIFVWRKKNHLS